MAGKTYSVCMSMINDVARLTRCIRNDLERLMLPPIKLFENHSVQKKDFEVVSQADHVLTHASHIPRARRIIIDISPLAAIICQWRIRVNGCTHSIFVFSIYISIGVKEQLQQKN